MASLPILSILEKTNVSPPPDTVSDACLPLTFIDIPHIPAPPFDFVLFYQLPSLTKTEFIETIAPKLKRSLSITLQHFLPFAGNIIVYPTSTTTIPEIRYIEGDSVKVTFAECDLDFNDLTGYHPRNCDKFYHLIPPLGDLSKTSDYLKIPVFSLQVTFFPNCGFSMGVTYSHSLADAISLFCFLNAWTSIAQCGTDESFLANGTLPFYERVVNFPERDKSALVKANFETLFGYEGFITAAKLIGENLHKLLTDKDGILADKPPEGVKEGWPKSFVVIYGSPKLRHYDLDFGWGKPKKFEIVLMDHGFHRRALVIPIDGGKEFNQDMEFSVCLTASQMETFATAFNKGLETYI